MVFKYSDILLLLICLVTSCSYVSPPSHIPESQIPTELSIDMQRTGCYGTCPAYTVSLQPSGKVTFDGRGFTKIIGRAEDVINDEKKEQLVAEITKADFFKLDDAYTQESRNCPTTRTDNSTVTLSIRLNDKSKTVVHYLGCRRVRERDKNNTSDLPVIKETDWLSDIYPQNLYVLENKIDEIVGTQRWTGKEN